MFCGPRTRTTIEPFSFMSVGRPTPLPRPPPPAWGGPPGRPWAAAPVAKTKTQEKIAMLKRKSARTARALWFAADSVADDVIGTGASNLSRSVRTAGPSPAHVPRLYTRCNQGGPASTENTGFHVTRGQDSRGSGSAARCSFLVLAGTAEGSKQSRLHRGQFFLRRLVARPEEAPQSVPAFSRNDMNVKVRHALAHDTVHRDEGAVGLHRELHGLRQHLGIQKQRSDQVCRKIVQRGVMFLRDEQAVAGEERPVIEEGQGNRVFEDNFRGQLTCDDPAEQAPLCCFVVFLHCALFDGQPSYAPFSRFRELIRDYQLYPIEVVAACDRIRVAFPRSGRRPATSSHSRGVTAHGDPARAFAV